MRTLRSHRTGRAAGLVAALTTLAWTGLAEARVFYVMRITDAWALIDPTSIETGETASQRRMWTITVQRNIFNETPPQPGYVRTLNEYDCDAQKTRWRSFTAFSRSGVSLMSRENPSLDWVDVTAGSSALVEWRVACGYSTGDSAVAADSVAQVVIALMRAWDPPTPAVAPPPPVAPKTAALKPKSSGQAKPRPGPQPKPGSKLAPTKPK